MPSSFYISKFSRRFNISMLALEYYSMSVENLQEDERLIHCILDTLKNVCGVGNPSQEDVNYFIDRLKEFKDKLEKHEGPEEPSRSFGTSYLAYLQELSSEAAIWDMVDFNPKAAAYLYCEADKEDVDNLLRTYVRRQNEFNLLAMEATLYGSGNHYKEDNPSKGSQPQPQEQLGTKVYDINSKEGLARLRSLGLLKT